MGKMYSLAWLIVRWSRVKENGEECFRGKASNQSAGKRNFIKFSLSGKWWIERVYVSMSLLTPKAPLFSSKFCFEIHEMLFLCVMWGRNFDERISFHFLADWGFITKLELCIWKKNSFTSNLFRRGKLLTLPFAFLWSIEKYFLLNWKKF